jgi:hypothetical protein
MAVTISGGVFASIEAQDVAAEHIAGLIDTGTKKA